MTESQQKLQQRKAELKAKIELQKEGLKNTFLEIRHEIEPANLLQKAFSGGRPDNGSTDWSAFAKPLFSLAGVFIRDPRLSILVKLLGPLLLRFFSQKEKPAKPSAAPGEEKTANPETENAQADPKWKTRFYGSVRRGVSALRKQLKKGGEVAEEPAN